MSSCALGCEIPSAVTEAETDELRRLATGRRVLEIGSLLGYSTIQIAEVAAHVVSVDPHERYPADDPRPTLNTFIQNLNDYRVRDKVTVCVGTHDSVLPWLTDTFDMVFIDCTGEYDLTLDVMTKASKLLTHYGVMCVHDCGHPDWPGALDAVRAFGRAFRVIDRLAVIEGTWSR